MKFAFFPERCTACGSDTETVRDPRPHGLITYRQCTNPACQCLLMWRKRTWGQTIWLNCRLVFGYALALFCLWLFTSLLLLFGDCPACRSGAPPHQLHDPYSTSAEK